MNNLKYDELPYGLLPDWAIAQLARQGMISPFVPELVKEVEVQGHEQMAPALRKVISFGASSFGFDLRLSSKEFLVFRHIPGTVVNPKRFNPENLECVPLHEDKDGQFFILPAHSYGLGVVLEKLAIPEDVTALFIGKSTYARAGIICNLTPGEACMSDDTDILAKTGWKPLKDVILGEEVLTWNPELGCS
ncbi:MAG TPA: hypothetical protein V6C63_07735, partial [Allocoleopsis sp.]